MLGTKSAHSCAQIYSSTFPNGMNWMHITLYLPSHSTHSQSRTYSSFSSLKLKTMSLISQWISKNGQNSRIPLENPLHCTIETVVSSKNVEIRCHYHSSPGPAEVELPLLSCNLFFFFWTSKHFPLKHLIWFNPKGLFFRNGRDRLIFLYSGWKLSPVVNMVPCLPPLSELGTRRNLYNDSLLIGLYFFCMLHLRGSLSFVSCKWQFSFSGPPSCLGRNVTHSLSPMMSYNCSRNPVLTDLSG